MKAKIIVFLVIVIAICESYSQIECGIHKIVRPIIIGGNSTIRGEQPWKAALIRSNGELFCGGSLVSNKAVATAAHCIKSKQRIYEYTSEDFSVVLGSSNLLKTSEKGRVNASVKSIRVHPDWNIDNESFDSDIAILILDMEVQFSNTIQPVCLSKPQSPVAQATEGIAIGFGRTETGTISNIAKKLKIPIKSFHDCAKEKEDLKQFLTARTFCGGPGDGRGVCDGDSGSGLYVFHNDRYYLRGTASATTGNNYNECDVNTLAIFVDTAEYCGWIQSGGLDKYAQCSEYSENDLTTTQPTTTSRKTTRSTTRLRTTTEKPSRHILYGGDCLYAGEFIESPNKCFKAIYQGDGNFVVYRTSTMQVLWQSHTHGTCTNIACMQVQGNFVVYDCNKRAVWHSPTNGHPGARMIIQSAGNLVIYGPMNKALWWSRDYITPC